MNIIHCIKLVIQMDISFLFLKKGYGLRLKVILLFHKIRILQWESYFGEHGETPGLGAEVDKPWFQNQFKIDKGKKIFNSNNDLVSISLNKKNTYNKPHEVDGITGATVTADGVTKFLKRDLNRYKKLFDWAKIDVKK